MWYPKTMRKLKVFGYGVQKLFRIINKKSEPKWIRFFMLKIKLITVSSL